MVIWWIIWCLCSIPSSIGSHHAIQPVTCQRDEEFLSLVHAPGTRSLMYIFCHHQLSAEIARNVSSCWGDWVQILLLHESPYFESQAYRSILPHLSPNWDKFDYVITATYKTLSQPIGKSILQSFDAFKHAFAVLQKGKYDVYPFLRCDDDSRYWGEKFHGRQYSVAWDALLEHQGYSSKEIHAFDHKGVFFRNIYVATASAFRHLVHKMSEGIVTVEKYPVVRSKFEVDSGYSFPDVQLARKVYNHSNYHMHPFIFERLPSFYLHNQGFRVCLADPDCPQNF